MQSGSSPAPGMPGVPRRRQYGPSGPGPRKPPPGAWTRPLPSPVLTRNGNESTAWPQAVPKFAAPRNPAAAGRVRGRRAPGQRHPRGRVAVHGPAHAVGPSAQAGPGAGPGPVQAGGPPPGAHAGRPGAAGGNAARLRGAGRRRARAVGAARHGPARGRPTPALRPPPYTRREPAAEAP